MGFPEPAFEPKKIHYLGFYSDLKMGASGGQCAVVGVPKNGKNHTFAVFCRDGGLPRMVKFAVSESPDPPLSNAFARIKINP